MRAIVQVTFRLVELRLSHDIGCVRRLLLMRSHNELTSIYLGRATIHLDYLHEAWSLEPFVMLFLHLAKNRLIFRKVIIQVYQLILLSLLVRVNSLSKICDSCALSSLMHVAHSRYIAARFVRRY